MMIAGAAGAAGTAGASTMMRVSRPAV